MSFLSYKHLVFSFLLINFISIGNQLVEAQILIDPNFDQAILPFGSEVFRGSFSSRCNRDGFNGAGATITMLNNCSFTVWAAAIPGGGRRLDGGQDWTLNVPSDTARARIWGRTNCSFDSSGRGRCETGDCGGVLKCQRPGAPPNTLAEYSLNQVNNLDFFDISLVDGFNIPIEFSPTSKSNGCSKGVSCAAHINGQCPAELRAPGGCNGPCTVFKTDQYCCTNGTCGPTNYSKFFKELCPNAYSYPRDDATSTFTCPAGTNYDVVFCPF